MNLHHLNLSFGNCIVMDLTNGLYALAKDGYPPLTLDMNRPLIDLTYSVTFFCGDNSVDMRKVFDCVLAT